MDLVAQNIAFYVIAAVIVGAAWRVVSTNDIVHAALWLVVVLAGAGTLYLLAGAEFVATTQYLVYIGAIVVLFLFGIMLTRAPIGGLPDVAVGKRGAAFLVAVLLGGVMIYALIDSFSDVELEAGVAAVDPGVVQPPVIRGLGEQLADPDTDLVALAERLDVDVARFIDGEDVDEPAIRYAISSRYVAGNTEAVSDSIFSRYLIPFEAISVLLLAALIGAVVLARKD